ncbi:Peptide methionine sulfoxide reductase MsrA [Pseudoalteromonas sp. P1-9]|uniref:peptide-methionine (S)-S-oxide reductase MsrA n=1 Tax=unclassified Pseudoalteromonas TaxID=194690 RepID=UPI0006D6445B|nr:MULTISPECIES: peptide-methionine (S)-S-oxide reductase MsrA [unclassified Pseudoalteromonas]KPV94844.1 Peptide methionine sulfoxide reductase MsrA [Pseudoalteromonas sp. P1-9]
MQTAIFGGGCFWCIDAAFRRLKGVQSVLSGYSGGHLDNPTYQDICTGLSGHAEVVKIEFDEQVISYSTLLQIFFELHDPTQLNRQGNDVGTQYRSVIFYLDDVQKLASLKMLASQQALLADKIVTELSPATLFYSAETYHQDYYRDNPNQPYCSIMIGPKLAKFSANYATLLAQ